MPKAGRELYLRMSHRAAAQVMRTYSTSFSAASGLLSRPVRRDIATLYAVVRIADEIVDGVAAESGLGAQATRELLDAFEADVLHPPTGMSVNPILQAWSDTATRCHIDPAHVRAFFDSMRADLSVAEHDEASLDAYIFGSAEAVGLMCLAIFLTHDPRPTPTGAERERLDRGARRLGAAFQKVNFLRDLAADSSVLGRSYIPGVSRGGRLDDVAKDALIADIRADLADASEVIPRLPRSCRVGVRAAALIFGDLADRLDSCSADQLYARRISVPGPRKAALLVRAAVMSRG